MLNDEILFCRTEHSETMLSATLNNVYMLDYLLSGRDKSRGYLFRWFDDRNQATTTQS